MRLDKYSQPIYEDQDIFDFLYEGDFEQVNKLIAESSPEVEKLIENSKLPILTSQQINYNQEVSDFDINRGNTWFISEEYKNFDIEGFLAYVCPKENYQRLIDELQEYRKRNLIDLLRWLKYFVDTCRAHNIVWGVGRGSSVASYVLFLLGVHRIDSVKYNLDWREFLR